MALVEQAEEGLKPLQRHIGRTSHPKFHIEEYPALPGACPSDDCRIWTGWRQRTSTIP
jgi:hypothetical protein